MDVHGQGNELLNIFWREDDIGSWRSSSTSWFVCDRRESACDLISFTVFYTLLILCFGWVVFGFSANSSYLLGIHYFYTSAGLQLVTDRQYPKRVGQRLYQMVRKSIILWWNMFIVKNSNDFLEPEKEINIQQPTWSNRIEVTKLSIKESNWWNWRGLRIHQFQSLTLE